MKTLPEYTFPTKVNLIDELNALKVEQPGQMINYIIGIFEFHKSNETRLYSKLLRPVLGRNYSKIMKSLIDGGLIAKSKPFVSGAMSTSYILIQKSERSKETSSNIYLERLLDPTKIYSEDSINKVKASLICKYKEWIKDTTLRVTKEEYDSLPENQQRYVNDINNNNFWCKTDKFNARMYTPITTLEKTLRKKIKIDGEETIEVDINSSFCQQIYQLQYLFNADKNFRTCVEKYDVYAHVAYHTKTSRDKAKNYFNASLNAKQGGWQHPAILKLFPQLFAKVNELRNSYGNNIISRILFRKEMFKVIEIAQELAALNIKHFTIHDCFLVKKSEAELVQKIILKHNLKTKLK